jgi:hypothetical protein
MSERITMRLHEIENWALKVIDQVNSGQPIEDSRVELKAEWIDHYKAARRIAGHANAARGAPILWLIGVDEKQGVKGVKHEDLADWFSQVKSQFDGITPLMQDINVRVSDDTVVALLFETERAPFVVKNPRHGQEAGVKIAREVPWREGTSVRSAKREELIRILSPLQSLPDFEFLRGDMSVDRYEDRGAYYIWHLHLEFYIVPDYVEQIAIPFHKTQVECNLPHFGWMEFEQIGLGPPTSFGYGGSSQTLSQTISRTQDEVIIVGPGRIVLTANQRTAVVENSMDEDVHVVITMTPANQESAVKIDDIILPQADPKGRAALRWDTHPTGKED